MVYAAEELHLPVKDIHKILRKKFLNVVNIYAKRISVECLNFSRHKPHKS